MADKYLLEQFTKYINNRLEEYKNKNRVPIIRKSNDELSNYKPRELIDSLRDIIEELRNRGYVVDVSYSYKIKL